MERNKYLLVGFLVLFTAIVEFRVAIMNGSKVMRVPVDFRGLLANCSVFRTGIHASMPAALRDLAVREWLQGV
jgi:hypothetical protein